MKLPVLLLTVRPESPGDFAAVCRVNEAAFGRCDEATLVESLREEKAVLLSLVGELNGSIVGHILFSRMWIDHAGAPTPAAALAPVAVLPEYQRRGVGGSLIEQGLVMLKSKSERLVFVLGEPHYYARFGFSAAKTKSIATPFPPGAFMALELVSGALNGIVGKARYARSFGLA